MVWEIKQEQIFFFKKIIYFLIFKYDLEAVYEKASFYEKSKMLINFENKLNMTSIDIK